MDSHRENLKKYTYFLCIKYTVELNLCTAELGRVISYLKPETDTKIYVRNKKKPQNHFINNIFFLTRRFKKF